MSTALTDFGFVTTALLVAMKEFYTFSGRRILEVMKVYIPVPFAVAGYVAGGLVRDASGLSGSHVWGPIAGAATIAVIYGVPLMFVVLTTRGRSLLGIKSIRG